MIIGKSECVRWSVAMRRLLLAAVMFGAVSAAQAADLPDFLRGGFSPTPAPRVNWQGYYVGAQVGTGTSDMDFTGATRSVAAHLLADTALDASGNVSSLPVGGKIAVHGNGIGGFAGYNSQWDDVVVGVEFSYLHGKFGGSQTDSLSRIFNDVLGFTDTATYQATGTMMISDLGTFRARAGYAIGSFLPYLFGGVALGQADIVRTARIFGTQVKGGANIPFDVSATDGKFSHLIFGYSAGLGVDVMLAAGLFLRTEWEYIRFTSAVDTNVNTVRVGVGYKF
jgi:outer membrane immunogenic protein